MTPATARSRKTRGARTGGLERRQPAEKSLAHEEGVVAAGWANEDEPLTARGRGQGGHDAPVEIRGVLGAKEDGA